MKVTALARNDQVTRMALILSRSDIQRCLTMHEAISVMRQAFAALHTNQAQMPQRLAVELAHQGVALLMPSLYNTIQQGILGLKLVTIMPENPLQHLPLTNASIMLLDAESGRTLAILEGSWLTTIRTGAATGLATDLLANPDASILALFGAGAQAPMQVVAINAVRSLSAVYVVNRSPEHFQQLQETLQSLLGRTCPPIWHAHSATEALRGATLVACATTATSPLFQWSDIAAGTHINAIGAFTPSMCEIDAQTLAHARIVVDQREAALAEAGDLLQARAAGAIAGPETWHELGELLASTHAGRCDEDEVTCFKSVGLGVQDAAIALHVYNKAREIGVGIEVDI